MGRILDTSRSCPLAVHVPPGFLETNNVDEGRGQASDGCNGTAVSRGGQRFRHGREGRTPPNELPRTAPIAAPTTVEMVISAGRSTGT